MEKKKCYVTTTLPYVNAVPHMGHALECVEADAFARARKIFGDEVFFNVGTDEHGLKIYRRALEDGLSPKEYTDSYAEKFKDFFRLLNIEYTAFVRTTDEYHIKAAQGFWKRCAENGDIYKGTYKAKYCVGCELEKTDSELENGKCPFHINQNIEEIEEENYFFRYSKYTERLSELYEKNPEFVVPAHRLKEIKTFVLSGLKDFSISRLKSKMPWGIPVPEDEDHVMYVWFDALVNYISTLGWGTDDGKKFSDFWGTKDTPNAIQFAGKDNLRQQSAMWQAMLMSADLPLSKQIFIHGYINGKGGQKMSKSLGNVVDPVLIAQKFGTDALRYFLLREIRPFEDGEFSLERFTESYNAGLSKGLGNMVSRVLKMARNAGVEFISEGKDIQNIGRIKEYESAILNFEFQVAMDMIWEKIQIADRFIEEKEPFKLIKTDEVSAKKDISELLESVWEIAELLRPFMPETSKKILSLLFSKEQEIAPLFPRIETLPAEK